MLNARSRIDDPGMEQSRSKRYAFKMKLKPGMEAEYQRRHDEIWPELSALLRESGISDYSIFLDTETLTLFAVQKQAGVNRISQLPEHPLMRRWWDAMAPLMEVNPDHSPVCVELKEVFYMD